ncbi:hypothetical protein PV328_011526 [Microctonus aethiopoides]|uniref:Gustatory receptor n=1 Tax=Microctonus aethiopoides TaxID=144406 RepID=A0AA39C4N3_9HYME|nr:hypothetical protein PV328_011526 [Microctonus aethiopoides]
MPTYVCSWVLLQYSFALNALNERFTSLNKSLIKLGNISMKIPLQILFVKKIPLDHKVLSDIINIRLAYRILCEICDHVSDLFALPTLLGIIYFGSSTTYETYFILISFFTHDTTNINFARAVIGPFVNEKVVKNYTTESLNALLPLSLGIIAIVAITVYANDVVDEMGLIIDGINKLINIRLASREANWELEQFALEMLHRKLNFDACGVFSIDCTLLRSITSMTVTYLVLLVQTN